MKINIFAFFVFVLHLLHHIGKSDAGGVTYSSGNIEINSAFGYCGLNGIEKPNFFLLKTKLLKLLINFLLVTVFLSSTDPSIGIFSKSAPPSC